LNSPDDLVEIHVYSAITLSITRPAGVVSSLAGCQLRAYGVVSPGRCGPGVQATARSSPAKVGGVRQLTAGCKNQAQAGPVRGLARSYGYRADPDTVLLGLPS